MNPSQRARDLFSRSAGMLPALSCGKFERALNEGNARVFEAPYLKADFKPALLNTFAAGASRSVFAFVFIAAPIALN
jgi:hypothetical protein